MRLDGWKQIAAHLGVTVYQARSFREIGLPVRNTPDGRVWSTTEALWLWLDGVNEFHELRRKWLTRRPPGAVLH